MKLLICDDDTMTLRALEFQFKKEGFEILKAINGREARQILAENGDIDVLITDLYMPLMGGLELVTHIRKTLRRNMPIVVVSLVNVEDIILQALELGANDYMTKPLNLEVLSNRVKNLLKK